LEGYAYSNSTEDAKTGILTLNFNRAGSAPATVPYTPAPGSAASSLEEQEPPVAVRGEASASSGAGSKEGGGRASVSSKRASKELEADSGSGTAGEATNKKQKKR
jgi:hypothetical protein